IRGDGPEHVRNHLGIGSVKDGRMKRWLFQIGIGGWSTRARVRPGPFPLAQAVAGGAKERDPNTRAFSAAARILVHSTAEQAFMVPPGFPPFERALSRRETASQKPVNWNC